MVAEIVIRTLGEADAHALRVLRLRALVDAPGAFASTYETEVTEPESATAERLEQNDRGSFILGAFLAGALVGMLAVDRKTANVAHRAHVWGVFVASEARRRGAARALLDAAIARLKAAGIEQVHLTVSTDAGAARRLYVDAGFVAIATLKEALKLGSRYVDEDLMVLRL